MSKLPEQENENIIIGYENSDDAGVFRLNTEIALVQTLDFFTPIVDDPFLYGKIAAINSLNDVYAMGGKPLTALSIVCYPQKDDLNVLGEILQGGQKTLNDEGVAILGGHSVDDKEMKFGYSITGLINPNEVISNAGAKSGSVLVLTKPIGTGIISTGVKFEKASKDAQEAALTAMTSSAKKASDLMKINSANACTDITGFGLAGHTFEMAKASNKSFSLYSEKVPLLPDVLDLVSQKMLTRGDKSNRDYVGKNAFISKDVSKEVQSALFDPQTAGGLLISLDKENAENIVSNIESAEIVGEISDYKDFYVNIF